MKILPLAISGQFKPELYQSGKAYLEKEGFKFIKEPELRDFKTSNLNGADLERLSELEEAFLSSNIDLIWAVRGGYGVTRLLLKFNQKLSPEKILIGFSDLTALMLHNWHKSKIKSLHAPDISRISTEPAEVLMAIKQILSRNAKKLEYPKFNSENISGKIEGILMPVNLSMLVSLIGTDSMPSLKDSILILEEVNEPPYRIDRMLTHLEHAGILKGVKAIVAGHLTECGNSALAVFKERCDSFDIPFMSGFSMGHEKPNWPVIFGAKAFIKAQRGQACLKYLEEFK